MEDGQKVLGQELGQHRSSALSFLLETPRKNIRTGGWSGSLLMLAGHRVLMMEMRYYPPQKAVMRPGPEPMSF